MRETAKEYIETINDLHGNRSIYFTDIKTYLKAGDEHGKPHLMGYYTVRLYYDSADKDCQVGEEKIELHSYKKAIPLKHW